MSTEDSRFDELVAKQESSYEHIKSIVTNFKKDSESRKTIEYLNKRINALESHWSEFCCNHEVLKTYQTTKESAEYFTKNVFSITQAMFNETLQTMTNLRIGLLSKPGFSGEPKKGDEGFGDETDKRLSTLLRSQMCNFNALERAVSKVNLSTASEKWQLQDQLNILQTKWDSIDKIHWELSYLLQGSNKPYEEKFEYWEEIFDNLKEEISKKIWESSHYEKSTPKIELPEFNGAYNNWVSFRDLFLETIHNNPTLNKTQKMKYLKSKLKGEAEKLIKHLAVSAENYNSCFEIICHRYDNKRLLFTSYIDTLLNQPSIDKANAENLKKFHDTTKECLNALENIEIQIPVWGPLIVHLLLAKLDDVTYADYIKEMSNSRELPDLEEFMEFLELKFMALETSRINKSDQKPNNQNSKPNSKGNNKWKNTNHATLRNCPLCKANHVLMQCALFLDMDVGKRNQTVNELKLCKNCLFSHGGNKCISKNRCRTCNYKHHSLLHDDNFKGHYAKNKPSTSTTERSSNHINGDDREILLTTLQLKVKNKEGNYVTLRALLDQGSQVTLIAENAAQRLNLPRNKMNAAVTGVGTIMGTSKGLVKLECKSIHSDYSFTTEALVMRRLINNLPNSTVNTENWSHLDNIKLADPDFNISGPIDLLLGADIYSEVILEGILKQDQNLPVAQQTKLGWILCGATKQFNCLVTLNELENLTNFWENEEVPTESEKSPNDDYCENFYSETTERTPSGRYVVKMPMKENYSQNLGNSKRQAIAQFLQLEKKMARQEHFANLYKQFIKDYIELGHMKPSATLSNQLESFLPHHGVLRENSTTTKLRAVFNASLKTDSGYSLNDLMEKGPNLQKDILSLIVKWRSYKFVLTADIEKMYRQILIHQDQQHLQKIIWRESTKEPLKEMQLCTLTYGTKAAPFIAMRTLLQLARDEGNAYPLAQRALTNEFYMDDLITGNHDVETTKLLQKQLFELLKKGGFVLRKWASNDSTILTELSSKEKSEDSNFNFKQQEFSKTLGLAWNKINDTFSFTCEPLKNKKEAYSKRQLLSEISKIYDPLGWLAPMTIQAKLIFQKLWTDQYRNIDWDETLPEEITKEWIKIKSELSNINKISLQRWIHNYNTTIELQAFCDASENAYACVIYSRTTSPTDGAGGAYVTTLLAAKTKVAPVKNKTSVPRLELCGALLAAKLLEKIINALKDYHLKVSCWTDSKVVLAWLQGNQTKWDKYITHRTTQIKNIVPASNWGYVKTNENPADCATRGLSPSKLLNFSLWWEGPRWLRTQKQPAETTSETFTTKDGLIQACLATEPAQQQNKNKIIHNLLERHSDIDRITRILAWVLRFVNRMTSERTEHLTLSEILRAKKMIIKSEQDHYFGDEIRSLKEKGKLSNKSSLLKLYPILDSDGLLRVGGRLEYSDLPAERKHPIILPHRGRLTQLIVEKSHQKTLHGGARLTLAYTRNEYWITSGNRTVKRILRECVLCRRYSTNKNEQLMGNLPKERITPSRPFTHTGVDFTGHVEIKINKGRGVKTCKGYIAIFICMSTKAVHIELVSDLSTQTFIAALKRMCARRGTPKHIYSDNGTNFVGAAKVLNDEFQQHKTMLSPEFFNNINELQIEWHFNAPSWPTAGGLWEAAVRSMKTHLKRVIGQQKLTYEQFSTLLTQIEACLNSRPLCPLSEDVEDLDYLTPGHFLTGGPMLSLPFDEPEEMKSIDLRNNWKLIELMFRHYWNRWSQEYLHILQQRGKWQQAKENLTKGQLVLVKDSNVLPNKWPMGRVVELHPGKDDLVRVVTLKTKNGTVKRPITKLAPLPVTKTCDDEVKKTLKPITKNKKRGKAINSLFTMLLVAFTVLSPVQATKQQIQNFKITPLNDNHPIYFDPIGNIQLIHDEWKLLVYYNLTTFWTSTSKVERFVNHLADVCATMPNEPCHSTISQLKYETHQLDEYNQLLLSQHQLRKRRGYVNGVGNLARTLFGILDDNFAQKYSRDIEKIKNNEQYLLELIKNQTLILEAENNIIKKNENFVNAQFETIQKIMRQTQGELTVIQNRAQIMKTMNDINAGALTASLLISTLRRCQEMMLNALTDIYKGHLDMTLFTPQQLTEQLNNIDGMISKRLTLPIKNYDGSNIRLMYKLIYVRARLTEKYLLFELHIPLISDDEYTLYHSMPIPKPSAHGQCKQIAITTPYIAINFVKNTYIQIEDDDLQHCTVSMEDNYICHAYKPITGLHSLTASCEAKILSQNENISCNWSQYNCNNQWRKLHKPNVWLYNCNTECQTRIVCENQITSTIITMAGLLALSQDCIIQLKDATIYSYNVFGSKTKISMDLEVPIIDSPNDILDGTKGRKIILEQLNMSEEHRILENKINSQREREHLPDDISIHDISNYSISTLVVGGIAIAILWKLRHRIFSWKNKRTPTDKHQSDENEIELQEITYSEIKTGNSIKAQPKPAATAREFKL